MGRQEGSLQSQRGQSQQGRANKGEASLRSQQDRAKGQSQEGGKGGITTEATGQRQRDRVSRAAGTGDVKGNDEGSTVKWRGG